VFTLEQTFHGQLCDCVEEWECSADMSKTYSGWLGRQVVLQVKAGESLVPLRGLVVNESNNVLRFRLDGCWEVDIYKEMVWRVEIDNYEAFQLGNWRAGNEAPAAVRSDSMPMLSRSQSRFFDRWWSEHFSWQLMWKTIISAGLVGSILFVLALHMSVAGPARFICGYLGLVLSAVSLGCGMFLLIESFREQSPILAKCSKLLASFLDWFRQPIHL